MSGVESPDLRVGTIFACPCAHVVERPKTKKTCSIMLQDVENSLLKAKYLIDPLTREQL